MPRPSDLTQHEAAILSALDECAPRAGEAVSGHAIRERVLNRGFAKRDVVLAMGALVERGVIERMKVVDQDGFFYTGYRRVASNAP